MEHGVLLKQHCSITLARTQLGKSGTLSTIWQRFLCLLDKGIAKICKKLKSLGGLLSYLQDRTANLAAIFCPAFICPQKAIVGIQFLAYFCSPLFKQLRHEKCCQYLKKLFVVFHHSRNILCYTIEKTNKKIWTLKFFFYTWIINSRLEFKSLWSFLVLDSKIKTSTRSVYWRYFASWGPSIKDVGKFLRFLTLTSVGIVLVLFVGHFYFRQILKISCENMEHNLLYIGSTHANLKRVSPHCAHVTSRDHPF